VAEYVKLCSGQGHGQSSSSDPLALALESTGPRTDPPLGAPQFALQLDSAFSFPDKLPSVYRSIGRAGKFGESLEDLGLDDSTASLESLESEEGEDESAGGEGAGGSGSASERKTPYKLLLSLGAANAEGSATANSSPSEGSSSGSK